MQLSLPLEKIVEESIVQQQQHSCFETSLRHTIMAIRMRIGHCRLRHILHRIYGSSVGLKKLPGSTIVDVHSNCYRKDKREPLHAYYWKESLGESIHH